MRVITACLSCHYVVRLNAISLNITWLAMFGDLYGTFIPGLSMRHMNKSCFHVFSARLSFRVRMRGRGFQRKKTAWRCSPGGNWSQTGTAMRSQRSRRWMMTRPLREAQTSTLCWSQQVRPVLLTMVTVSPMVSCIVWMWWGPFQVAQICLSLFFFFNQYWANSLRIKRKAQGDYTFVLSPFLDNAMDLRSLSNTPLIPVILFFCLCILISWKWNACCL